VDDDLDWAYARQQFARLAAANKKLKAYEPVIKAARRWYAWKMDPTKKHPPKVAFTMYEMDLCERIEELDELEG
jgi:hypothetical protein